MSCSNEQWINVKSPKDIMLEGVNVEIDWHDTLVNSIIVRDANGNALRIVKGDYSGMKAMIPAPPPTVTKYDLCGTLCGSPFSQVFTDESDAIEQGHKFGNELGSQSCLKVEKVKVPA